MRIVRQESEMEKMTGYAHAHGKKLYVTLNTLIKEAELPLLVDTLANDFQVLDLDRS